MPIPTTVEKEPDEEEYTPHGEYIASRVLLFKQTDLENWFCSMSIEAQKTAYCLFTYQNQKETNIMEKQLELNYGSDPKEKLYDNIYKEKDTDGNIVVASLYETAATEKDDSKLVCGTYA
jgi:hypothetical protein